LDASFFYICQNFRSKKGRLNHFGKEKLFLKKNKNAVFSRQFGKFQTQKMALDQYHEVEAYEKAKGEMSFFDHISALRGHLLRMVLAVFVMTIVMFVNQDFLFKTLLFGPTKPWFPTFQILCDFSAKFGLGESLCIHPTDIKVITRDMGEAFLTHMVLSFWVGVICAFPYILWEIWRFIGPGLYDTEAKAVRGGVFICSVLFMIGVSFGYFVIAPFSINFLMNYDVGVENTTTLESYLDYMVMFTIPMGLIFELPILSYFLATMGILTPKFMKDYRRYAVVIIFIIAAVITPSADILTQCLVAFPLLVLYELSITVVKRVAKKRDAKLSA
jgi:sec-independent protein translocase protein TatC